MTQKEEDDKLLDGKKGKEEERADAFQSLFLNFYETRANDFEESLEGPRKAMERPVRRNLSNFQKISDSWF